MLFAVCWLLLNSYRLSVFVVCCSLLLRDARCALLSFVVWHCSLFAVCCYFLSGMVCCSLVSVVVRRVRCVVFLLFSLRC